MNIGKTLDRSFKALRDNLYLIYGVTFLIYCPFLPFQMIIRFYETQIKPEIAGPYIKTPWVVFYIGSILLFAIVAFFLTPLATMAITSVMSNLYKGRRITVTEAFKNVIRLFPSAILLIIAITALVSIGTLFCIIPGVILHIMFYPAFPTLVVERTPPTVTLEKCYDLVRGNYLNIFALILIVGIIKFVVSSSISWVGSAFFSSPSPASIFLYSLSNFTGTFIVAPIDSIVATMVYFELREKKHGLDLILKAESISKSPQRLPHQHGNGYESQNI